MTLLVHLNGESAHEDKTQHASDQSASTTTCTQPLHKLAACITCFKNKRTPGQNARLGFKGQSQGTFQPATHTSERGASSITLPGYQSTPPGALCLASCLDHCWSCMQQRQSSTATTRHIWSNQGKSKGR
eukprot:1160112-Pelagomonas_calceolata.AAC.5